MQFYLLNQQTAESEGPYTFDELKIKVANGEVLPESEVWPPDGGSWIKAQKISGLFEKAQKPKLSDPSFSKNLQAEGSSNPLPRSPSKDPSLEDHKFSLRRTTAYPRLRLVLSVSAWITGIGFVIIGLLLTDSRGTRNFGPPILLLGPLLAVLQYFLASVYFDIADAGLNTSMSTQELLRMQSSKETASE